MSSSRIGHGIIPLLEKMKSQDSDFRYMALNDLMTELSKDGFVQLDEGVETPTVNQVLDLMKDPNGEVKNMAVKCLGILVKKTREKQMQSILDKLVDYISSKEEELRDIAALGLKTVTAEIPARSNFASIAANKLAPKLIAQIEDPSSSQELLIDSLDILYQVMTRFSSIVSQSVQLQKSALATLLQAMGHSRPAVRKRFLTALGALGSCSTSEIFTQLSVQISTDLSSGSVDKRKTAVQLIGILARVCPRRLGRRLPEFMPQVIDTVKEDDDELREVCLQTTETILLRCPTEVTPFVNSALQTGLELIKHDPNYAGDMDDDEDEEMADAKEEDEDDDLIDEDYSDDDDMSWKVRRASAKLLNAAITSRPELLSQSTSTVAPILVQRFSEREESVRLKVLDTFLALLEQIQLYGGSPQATEVMGQSPGALKRKRQDMKTDDGDASPRGQLTSLVPSISKALGKELVSKSIPTRYKSFTVLRELVVVINGGLDSHLDSLLSQTEKALKGAETTSGPGSNLKAEILGFLRVLFLTHPAKSFEVELPRIIPIIIGAIEDKLHRNCVEAFQACSQLVMILRPLSGVGAARAGQYKAYIEQIYDATVARLNRVDSDQEIKERGLACLGVLLAHADDDLQNKHVECFELLLNRLRNEVTRYATVKVVAQIVTSPVCQGPVFDSFVQECIGEVATLLRKSNRLLKLAAFDCLTALLSRSASKLSTESADIILSEVQPLLNQDVDMNLLPLILKSVCLILKSSASAKGSVQESTLPELYHIVRSPLAQGAVLDSLLEFFKVYVGSDPTVADQTISDLLASLEKAKVSSSGTHAYSTIARCIGAVIVVSPASISVVDRAAQTLRSSRAKDLDVYFSLLLLGELGRFNDFSARKGLFDKVLSFYTADSEEVKIAAAFAVGNIAIGNLGTFLPVIEQDVKSGKQRQFLSLHALKELITHGSADQLVLVADRVWVPLFDVCGTKEEGVRNIVAECLARLTLTDSSKYLSQLQERLRSSSASTRAAVIAAVRFTLTESSSSYDELLAPVLVEFLTLLRDPELDVRRHAMFALNSAAHNKPYLIRDHLGMLLPLLYNETHMREELLRKVSMGPFTVTTDDGLDLRKNAYETMYQLLDTCLSRIRLPEYLDRVIAGLSDDDGIKVLSYLMLVRLSELAPVHLTHRLDDLTDPISATLKTKLKDNSTKQEIEKAAELQRFVFRALVALDKLGTSNAKFSMLVREAKTSAQAALYREMEAAHAGVTEFDA